MEIHLMQKIVLWLQNWSNHTFFICIRGIRIYIISIFICTTDQFHLLGFIPILCSQWHWTHFVYDRFCVVIVFRTIELSCQKRKKKNWDCDGGLRLGLSKRWSFGGFTSWDRGGGRPARGAFSLTVSYGNLLKRCHINTLKYERNIVVLGRGR